MAILICRGCIHQGNGGRIYNLYISIPIPIHTEICCNIQQHNQEYPSHCPRKAPSQMGHNKSGEAVSHNLLISCRSNYMDKLLRMCFCKYPKKVMVLRYASIGFQKFEGVFVDFFHQSSHNWNVSVGIRFLTFSATFGRGLRMFVFWIFSKIEWKGLSKCSDFYGHSTPRPMSKFEKTNLNKHCYGVWKCSPNLALTLKCSPNLANANFVMA